MVSVIPSKRSYQCIQGIVPHRMPVIFLGCGASVFIVMTASIIIVMAVFYRIADRRRLRSRRGATPLAAAEAPSRRSPVETGFYNHGCELSRNIHRHSSLGVTAESVTSRAKPSPAAGCCRPPLQRGSAVVAPR